MCSSDLVVLIRTFISGPEGSASFFLALVIAQIGIFANLWHQHLSGAADSVMDDAIIVTVLLVLLLFGYFRVRSRL